MAGLYRTSSLEKLSSPEQLDRAITVTSPMSWVALIGITAIIAVTLAWSVLGSLPTIISASGIVASPISTNALFSSETGTVSEVYVNVGDRVGTGDAIISVHNSIGDVKTVAATQDGTISEILVGKDGQVIQGNEIARLSPDVGSDRVVVCYVPLAHSKQLKPDMKVLVYPASVNSQTSGHLEATIVNIDSYAASNTNMGYVLGTDNQLVDTFASQGAVVAVTCKLREDESTASGYYWSGNAGKTLPLDRGTLVRARIVVDEVAPIKKLFTIFNDGGDS